MNSNEHEFKAFHDAPNDAPLKRSISLCSFAFIRGSKNKSVFCGWFFLFFSIFQAAAFADGASEIYTPSEKKRLTSANSLDDRIRVYDTAFERIRKEIEEEIREDRFDEAARKLSVWAALLSESLADIEKNVNPRKKSGRLKQYEIHLRQAINGLRTLRMRSPMELYDALILFEEKAEETRRKFMDILFLNSS